MRVYSVKNAIGWGGLDVSSFDFDCHFDFDWGERVRSLLLRQKYFLL